MTSVNSFFDAIGESLSFLNSVHPLAAIWLEKPVITAQDSTCRIRPGHLIKVENGIIENCNDTPTHEILGCFGAQNHSFSIKAKNLQTGKEETIKM